MEANQILIADIGRKFLIYNLIDSFFFAMPQSNSKSKNIPVIQYSKPFKFTPLKCLA